MPEGLVDGILAALATWRVSFLLTQEDGPWDVFARLRRATANSMPGRALECLYCTSVWVAAPIALWITPFGVRWVVTWLAISGAACLLHRATERTVSYPALDIMPLDPKDDA
jgi:hypothetical protein